MSGPKTNVPRHLLVVVLLAACSAGPGPTGVTSPMLTAAANAVFVGERTWLTAVFAGDNASIDGIGFVRSGIPVETPPLSRTTTFTLRVNRGYEHVEAQAPVQANYRNRIRVLAAAPLAQTNHVAAALPDGRAIVMGGNTSDSPLVPDSTLTQIFDPATEAFTAGPDLLLSAEAQVFTSVAALKAGGFLLVGTGLNAPVGGLHTAVTQVFDPGAPRFTRVGDAPIPGGSHRTATPLLDGGVLLSGGLVSSSIPVSDVVDRYDPANAQWGGAGHMLHPRVEHTATLLRDGRVLIAGGLSCCQAPPTPEFYSSTAEIYDPATGQFTAAGSMSAARGGHAAALLTDGRVLISGGDGNDPTPAPLGTEIFDPATGQFSAGGDLQTPRDSHSAVTLTDGRVLLIGGEVPPTVAGRVGVGVPSTEIYDPATGRWTAGPTLDPAFYSSTVTMLSNGKVLIFGGEDTGGAPQSAAALFE